MSSRRRTPRAAPKAMPLRDRYDDQCGICLEKFVNCTALVECTYSFCFACIMQWFEINDSCPLCKRVISHAIDSVGVEHAILPPPRVAEADVAEHEEVFVSSDSSLDWVVPDDAYLYASEDDDFVVLDGEESSRAGDDDEEEEEDYNADSEESADYIEISESDEAPSLQRRLSPRRQPSSIRNVRHKRRARNQPYARTRHTTP